MSDGHDDHKHGADDYHPFVPPFGSKMGGATPREHAAQRLAGPRAPLLFGAWEKLFQQPFKGMTTDGTVIPDLYSLEPADAPVREMMHAVEALLTQLSGEQKKTISFPVDSPQWRHWQNTELHVEDYGLRLDEMPAPVRESVMNVLRASMSDHGYNLARNVMKLNRFLGDIIGGPAVLGEWSYIFCLFGMPSMTVPWGWQFFGHHLALNCFVINGQMVLTPAFWGAEPVHADHGPFKGIRLFQDEEREGLALMRSFSREQQEKAIVAHSMMGGDLPEGRRHFADNLNLGGAFQDNRIVPYEGLRADAMSRAQQQSMMDLVQRYLLSLPPGPLKARIAEIERHLKDTHFCWIGGTGETNPFYYRIQSPVIFIEFDHHAGVFLTNPEPQKFHVHTIVRTPNGNDYGIDLLRLHYEQSDHHRNRHSHGGVEHSHDHGHHSHEHKD
jgi:hypothetical protein